MPHPMSCLHILFDKFIQQVEDCLVYSVIRRLGIALSCLQEHDRGALWIDSVLRLWEGWGGGGGGGGGRVHAC